MELDAVGRRERGLAPVGALGDGAGGARGGGQRRPCAARASRMLRRVLMAAATQPPRISCVGRSAGAQQRPHVDLERGARPVRLDHPPAAPYQRAPQPGLRHHGRAEARTPTAAARRARRTIRSLPMPWRWRASSDLGGDVGGVGALAQTHEARDRRPARRCRPARRARRGRARRWRQVARSRDAEAGLGSVVALPARLWAQRSRAARRAAARRRGRGRGSERRRRSGGGGGVVEGSHDAGSGGRRSNGRSNSCRRSNGRVIFSYESRHRGPCPHRRAPRAGRQHAARDPRPRDAAGLRRRARGPLDRPPGRRPRA